MRGFLLDTNIPSELTRPKPDPRVERWLEDAKDENLFLSVVSLGEIRKGLRTTPAGKRRAELVEWVQTILLPWFDGRILPVSQPIAEQWGDLVGEFETRGITISMADGLIAATAIVHDLTVVTRNTKDFPTLRIPSFNPWLAS